MINTRKATRKKGETAIDAVLTSYKSTCDSLNLPLHLSCCNHTSKKEQDVAITKKGVLKKLISTKT